MSILASLSQLMGLPDPRSPAQIDADVVEELEFHVEMRARDFAAEGLPLEEACRRAEACFGDFESIRRQCRAIHLEERVVLQRIQTVLIVVLVLAVGVMGWSMVSAERRSRQELEVVRAELMNAFHELKSSRTSWQDAPDGDAPLTADELRLILAQNGLLASERADALGEEPTGPDPEHDAATWIERFAARPNDWRYGWSLAERIAELPPEVGARIMAEIWTSLTPEVKHQVLKPFVFGAGHPAALSVLHLAATDADLETQSRAFGYLRAYAFQDFSVDYEGYLAWTARFGELPLDQVLTQNAEAFVQRASVMHGEDLVRELELFERIDFDHGAGAGVSLAKVMRDAGGLQLLERMLADSAGELQVSALAWVGKLGADEQWMREHVLPRVEDSLATSDETLHASLSTLARRECAFAREPVTSVMRARLERRDPALDADAVDGVLWEGARALAAMGDAAAIPDMIALIAARPCYDTIYGVGYYGLSELTGVEYDESHDGAWWVQWWELNALRFPEGVRSTPIPVVPLDDR